MRHPKIIFGFILDKESVLGVLGERRGEKGRVKRGNEDLKKEGRKNEWKEKDEKGRESLRVGGRKQTWGASGL